MKKTKEIYEKELKAFFDEHIDPDVKYIVVRGDSYPRARIVTLKVTDDYVIAGNGAYWYYEDFKRALFEKEGGIYRRKIFRLDQGKEAADYIKWCFRRLIESQKKKLKIKKRY